MAPLITLTTDFGTRDAYVAELKGVLYSEGPEALTVVDLSHELAPFEIHAAALFVRAALPRFPAGSVHVVVVDPGVGSARRAIIVERADMILIGPDNGVFSYLFDGRERVYEIELHERAISSTFHGRDLFAPVAARIARGAVPATFGPRLDSYERMTFPLVDIAGDTLYGRVIHIDHYGNLITNISQQTLRGFLGQDGTPQVSIGERTVSGLSDHYAQAPKRELLALIGSSGLLEVAAREASAARMLGAEVGHPVRVARERVTN